MKNQNQVELYNGIDKNLKGLLASPSEQKTASRFFQSSFYFHY